jgi:hypothetical protein
LIKSRSCNYEPLKRTFCDRHHSGPNPKRVSLSSGAKSPKMEGSSMFHYVSPTPGHQPRLYTLHCSRGTLIDAFPGCFTSRDEALGAALNLLKCPNWTHDMWLRLDEPSGQSLGTDDIRRILGMLRHRLPHGLIKAPSADRGRADRSAPAIGVRPAWGKRH